MKREKYLDYAKGFAILFLLFSHTMNTADYSIGSWITSFHMPIFFIISGIIHSMKDKLNTTGADTLKLVRKRVFQLGIPYLIFCGVLAVFYTVLSRISSNSNASITTYLFKIFTLQGIDSLWFIPCYFVAEVLLSISNRSKHTQFAAIAMCGIIFGYFILIKDYPEQWYICLILKILVCFSFMLLGYYLGKHLEIFEMPIMVFAVFLVLGIIGAVYNGTVGIGALRFGNVVLFYANAIITSVALLALFRKAEQHSFQLKWLSFFGVDSVVVLCTNNLLIEIIRLLDYKLTGNYLLEHGMLGCVLFFAMLAILEYGIIRMSQVSFFGILFGKNRRKT